MDLNALNAALAALAANQQQQQQQLQLQQKQMPQQQNFLTALTNRLLAVPAPFQPVVPPVPAVVVQAVLDVDVKYSRSTGESIQDWLQMANRKMCRRWLTPLTDAELVPYLIRDLYHPEMRSVLMGNPPVSVNALLIEVRRIEGIIESLESSPDDKMTAGKTDGKLTRKKCYNCNDFCHFSRDCPRQNLRGNRPRPENERETTLRDRVDHKHCSSPNNLIEWKPNHRSGHLQSGDAKSYDLGRGQSSFNIQIPLKNLRSLDGNVLAVVGETSLIVRCSGETINLKQVLVMENAAHPVVLGMDWIGKAGAVIYAEDEKPVMNVSKNCKEKMRSPSVNREKEEVDGDDA
ncbi:hypothetical protein DAPPUDRAFT_107539 [Daphnia pulex]|uniref:CCHC-type domain-containing protein n=1 Tax=Daphnia pulex TaxID=6669 RepID=E9GXG1_DAPPU|nr:hypothetical protein DAPPUDRAFT_107539 [Daphnia pulex]|eukprot:EFX75860.1 hypothetical protein DAPPUDRAFT_107539 [Daphnia pulex]